MEFLQDLFFIIPLAAALCNLFLLLTFLSAKKDKLIISFMGLLVTFTLWPLASFFMRLSLYPGEVFWFQVSMTSILFVPLLIYSYLHHYTNRRGNFLLTLFTLGTILMAVMNLFELFITDPGIKVAETGQLVFSYGISWFAIFPLLLAVLILGSAAKMIYSSIKDDGLPATMFRPFFSGIAIMFAAMVLDLIPRIASVFPVDPFACMLNAILIYYMLYKKRVFTLTQLASNSSTYLVSTVLTGLVLLSLYPAINLLFDKYFAAFSEYKTLLTAIIFSVMTILVFNLLKILANNLFVKGQHAREMILRNFGQAITRTLDRDKVLTLFTDLLCEHTHVETAYIFVQETGSEDYQLVSCTDKMRSTAVTISGNNPLIKWLCLNKEGIEYSNFTHTSHYKSMWESEKQTFSLLNVEFILPILCDGDLIGLTLLSPNQNKKPYSYSEINFLESVASIVSIAIKNAALYQTIQEEARTDSLTNLYNRRYFTDTFEKLFAENAHTSVTLILINFDDFKLFNELYGFNDGDYILVRFAEILKEVIGSRGVIGRYSGKEFSICLPMCASNEAEQLVDDIRARLNDALLSSSATTKKHLTFSAGICSYPVSASSSAQMFTYANMAVYASKKGGKNKTVVYSQKTHSRETNSLSYANMEALAQEYASTIYALTAAIDARDHYTFNHSKNVSYLATQLAQVIGLDEEHVEMIRQAGLLHDIGKISIPESILAKTSRLTTEEYEIMKSHVENSISMIRHLPSLDYVIPIAISHHERYDGTGYPRGLTGENIPIGGRCLGIADAFDAIVSKRPYKDPVPICDALQEIERNLGKQFDPDIGRTFIAAVQSGAIKTDIYSE